MMRIMNKIFLDSNILIYLYTSDEIKKTTVIKKLLNEHDNVLISTQVLFEFSYVGLRKLKLNHHNIEKALIECSKAFEIVTITYEMLCSALKISSKYNYSFPDSLIIATAMASECALLISEDMHNNHTIENKLKIINPFN